MIAFGETQRLPDDVAPDDDFRVAEGQGLAGARHADRTY